MKQIIKNEWLRRIRSQIGKPIIDRVPASYLLNTMYIEVTGNELRYPNSYNIKDENGNIPEYISVGTMDRINKDVAKWAGLPCQDPKLPSYSKIGGVVLSPQFQILNAIEQLGVVDHTSESHVGMKLKTSTIRRKISLEEVATLIEMDL